MPHPVIQPSPIAAGRAALVNLRRQAEPTVPTAEKATLARIRHSVTRAVSIDVEDDRPYKKSRRHLILCGLTPEVYRAN